MVNRLAAIAVAVFTGAGALTSAFASGANPVGDLLGDSPGAGGTGQAARDTYKNFGGQGIGDVGRKLSNATQDGAYKIIDLSNPSTRPAKIAKIRGDLDAEVARRKKDKLPDLPPFAPLTRDGKKLTNDLSPSEFAAYVAMVGDSYGSVNPPPATIRIVDQATLANMKPEDRKNLESWRIEKIYKVTRKITPIFETRTVFYPN